MRHRKLTALGLVALIITIVGTVGGSAHAAKRDARVVSAMKRLLSRYERCIVEKYETRRTRHLPARNQAVCANRRPCSLMGRVRAWSSLNAMANRGNAKELGKFKSVLKSAILRDCFKCRKHRKWHTKHTHCTMDCGGNNGITQGPCFEGCKAGVDLNALLRDLGRELKKVEAAIKKAGAAIKKAVHVAKNIHREAYYKFFQHVRRGVRLRALPSWFVRKYDRYFRYVRLAAVRIGKSSRTPSRTTAITDCKKIYLPVGTTHYDALMRKRLNASHYYLILHEIAHANQCMRMRKPRDGRSTKRDAYADMWFRQLPRSVLASISRGRFTNKAIHDRMPMERDAKAQANRIIRRTRIGRIRR